MNSLVNVGGNLTLDGVLNVTNGGGFGSGAYRLINYTGTLSDLILGLGTLPAGFTSANVTVTTGVPGQVNLVVSAAGAPTQFWDGSNTIFDGTVHGGSGTWNNFTTNFTDAGVIANQSWQNGIAVFSAAPGTVTLGDDIQFQGMQFTADGYTISGVFALQPTGTAMITTDPGVTATIAAPVTGPGGLNKAGLGLLSLTGDNTYSSGTTISGGVLQVGTDANLGNPSGGLILEGGELVATGSGFSTLRSVLLTANNGTLAAAVGGLADFQGNITGAGSLTVGDEVNSGTVSLSGTNTYLGNTTIVSGATLQTLSADALSATSAFLVAGTLNLNGFSNQIGSLAGTGTVTNNGPAGVVLTVGNDNSSTTFSGTLHDGTAAVGLNKSGIGTLTLTGADLYSGGTTISAGILQIGNGGTTGSIAGNVIDNSNLAFNHSDGVTFSGDVSGTGSLNQMGTGTLTLTGANTYTGGTTISAGTLQIGNGGTSGSIVGGVIDNGNLAFNHSDGVSIFGSVSGMGRLNQIGTGTLTLTGTNTYTGGTTISAGTLQIGNGAISGSIVGDVIDNGNLVFNRSDAVTFSGDVSGTGGLNQIGSGTATLAGTSTYSGATIVSAGTLRAGSTAGFSPNSAFNVNSGLDLAGFSNSVGSLEGSGTVINNGGTSATLTVGGNGGSTVFSGTLTDGSGTLGLTKSGTGTLTLSGSNTYSGATNLNGGILAVNNNGNLGTGALSFSGGALEALLAGGGITSGKGITLNGGGGTFLADTGTASSLSGAISGAGAFTKDGSGTLVLLGTNTYSGGTTIGTGTLQIGNGGTSGSIVGDLADNGNLSFNRSDAVAFTGTVSGTGGLSQIGPGTLTLTGADTYIGGTTISAGTLQVGSGGTSGSIVGNVIDNSNLVLTAVMRRRSPALFPARAA